MQVWLRGGGGGWGRIKVGKERVGSEKSEELYKKKNWVRVNAPLPPLRVVSW